MIAGLSRADKLPKLEKLLGIKTGKLTDEEIAIRLKSLSDRMEQKTWKEWQAR